MKNKIQPDNKLDAIRLVMIEEISDDCTFSCTITTPFEYESVNKAIADFKKALLANKKDIEVSFAGMNFRRDDYINGRKFCGDLPEILTLDDWFEKNKPKILLR